MAVWDDFKPCNEDEVKMKKTAVKMASTLYKLIKSGGASDRDAMHTLQVISLACWDYVPTNFKPDKKDLPYSDT